MKERLFDPDKRGTRLTSAGEAPLSDAAPCRRPVRRTRPDTT
jgi:hypothetical protein